MTNKKNKKPIVDYYTNDIYPASDLVVIKNYNEATLKRFGLTNLLDKSSILYSSDAVTCSGCKDSKTKNIVHVIVFTDTVNKYTLDKKICICSHECLHYVIDVMDYINQNITEQTCESCCYLQGWATERAFKTLMKK